MALDSSSDFEKDIFLACDTLNALNNFFIEDIADIKVNKSLDMPEEIWQLSQFWYDIKTSSTLTNELLAHSNNGSKIALLSAPTVYNQLIKSIDSHNNLICFLFEYDKRFSNLPNYVFYDYKNPLGISKDFKDYFDIVLLDPPFLSEECLSKMAETVGYLTSKKVILCTGQNMQEMAFKYLSVLPTNYRPTHINNLGNEFVCYSNYNSQIEQLKVDC